MSRWWYELWVFVNGNLLLLWIVLDADRIEQYCWSWVW